MNKILKLLTSVLCGFFTFILIGCILTIAFLCLSDAYSTVKILLAGEPNYDGGGGNFFRTHIDEYKKWESVKSNWHFYVLLGAAGVALIILSLIIACLTFMLMRKKIYTP